MNQLWSKQPPRAVIEINICCPAADAGEAFCHGERDAAMGALLLANAKKVSSF
jgi:hypothetical protein